MAEYDILQVAAALGLTFLNNRNSVNVPVVCPFCGDKRGKMSLRKEKKGVPANVFHCWHCGEAGTMYQLYARLHGIEPSHGREALDRFMASGNFASLPTVPEKNIRSSGAQIASADIRDNTYRTMLSMLGLKERDRSDLLRRGLTTEHISEGMFATTPKDNIGICRKLLNSGCRLEGVPGFYLNRSKEWALNVYPACDGYFCPVLQDGKVLGCQIRVADPADGNKYIWLSSSGKDRGCSSGTPSSFLGEPDSDTVIVTEGILKAYVAYCLQDVSIIGVPGVSSIGDVERILRKHDHKLVCEGYDMEKRENCICRMDYNPEKCAKCMEQDYLYYDNGWCMKKAERRNKLQKAIEQLRNNVEKCGLPMRHYFWELDENGLWNGKNKGIDDEFLFRKKSMGEE